MKTKSHSQSRGFTIVEVSMVLAIAGLIMVMIFYAVPQLQRNSRDSQRKNVVTRVKAEMETYASNNQGVYPFSAGGNCVTPPATYTTGTWNDFYCRYVSGQFSDNDPTTGISVFGASASNPTNPISPVSCGVDFGTCPIPSTPLTTGQAIVVYGAKCSGTTLVNSGGTPSTSGQSYAMLIGLDRAGALFCIDNN